MPSGCSNLSNEPPLEACTVREVKGYGRQKSYLDQYTDTEYSLAFLPKIEIHLWVDDSRAEEVIEKIVEVARTGRMGDGKIFVLSATEIVLDEYSPTHSHDANE